jgi:hypothetical protein
VVLARPDREAAQLLKIIPCTWQDVLLFPFSVHSKISLSFSFSISTAVSCLLIENFSSIDKIAESHVDCIANRVRRLVAYSRSY